MPSLDHYKRIFNVYIINRKKGAVSFWHTDLKKDESALELLKEKRLGPYYMDFSSKLQYKGPRDQQGIPLLNYYGNIGIQYNTCAIAQYGLGMHTQLLRSPLQEYAKTLYNISEWLVNNQEDSGAWHYKFDWNNIKSPWISGLAQGQAVSLLLRSYDYFKEDKFLDSANKGLMLMLSPENDGGCLSETEFGKWIEEHPNCAEGKQILNGFIWSLWSVLDYYLITKDQKYYDLFLEFFDTVVKCIHVYDIGFWTIYQKASNGKIPMVCSTYYQKLHNLQLDITLSMVYDENLAIYRNRWESYLKNSWYRMLSQSIKIYYKLRYK